MTTEITDEIKETFEGAVKAIGEVRETTDRLKEQYDGLDVEKINNATEFATKALEKCETLQKRLDALAKIDEVIAERLDAMEKHKAKGGGVGEPLTNPAYGKAYNAFLRRKSVKFEPEAVEANITGMVDLYYPKADEDTKAAVVDMVSKALVSGSQADGGVSAYTDGTYNLQVQEADDAGFTQNVGVIDREHTVGQPTLPLSIGAVTTPGVDNMTKFGVFATRRFIRLQVEATGVTTGATLEAFIALGADIVPV